MKGYTLRNAVTTRDQRVFFPGWVWLEDDLVDELRLLDDERDRTPKANVNLGPLPDPPTGTERSKWYECDVGDGIHLRALMLDFPLMKFWQPAQVGPMYCDAPTMSFQSDSSWGGWYVRIE
jgi:hypothetical protein